VYDSYIGKLQSAYESAASQDLGDEIDGSARAAAKKSMAKKKMSSVLAAVRVVSSSASASIEWAPEYQRTEKEEQMWKETSDTHTQQQHEIDDQRSCLSVLYFAAALLSTVAICASSPRSLLSTTRRARRSWMAVQQLATM